MPAARAVHGAGAHQGHQHHVQGAWSWGEQPWDSTGHAEGISPLEQGALFSTRDAKSKQGSHGAARGRWEMAPGRGNSRLQQDLSLHQHGKEGKALYKLHTRPSCRRVLFAPQMSSLLLLSPRVSFPALIHPGSASLERANQVNAFLTWHRKSLHFLSDSFFSPVSLQGA